MYDLYPDSIKELTLEDVNKMITNMPSLSGYAAYNPIPVTTVSWGRVRWIERNGEKVLQQEHITNDVAESVHKVAWVDISTEKES